MAVAYRLAGLVVVVKGADLLEVRARLFEQLAVVLARGAGRALRRRRNVAPSRAIPAELVAGFLQPW